MIDKENLNKVSLRLIELKLKTNILYLTSDVCERKNTVNFYKDCEELSNIKIKLNNLIVKLPEILNKKLDNRNDYLKHLKDINKELVTIAKPVFWYVNFANIVGKYVLNEYKLKQVTDNERVEFAKDMILSNCEDYFHYNINDIGNEQKIGKLFEFSQLLSSFPLRMTREKYEDYIKKSFDILFKNLPIQFVESGINMLKDNFAPFAIDNFKKPYPLIADMLETIFNMNLKQASIKELEELLDSIDDVIEKTEEIKEDLKMIYNDINYIIILVLFCVDQEHIFGDDFIIKDLYYSACDIISDANNDFLVYSVNDSSIDKIDYLTDEIEHMEDEFNKILNLAEKDNNINGYENFDEPVKIKLLIDDYFKCEITDEFAKISSVSDVKYADDKFLKQKTHEFIKFIDFVSENIDNKRMKFLKQSFLNWLPCSLSYNNIMEYIEYSLEAIEDNDFLFVTVSDVIEFFESIDFDSNNNCSCGDEHHHDHSCSCGHHH